MTIVVDWMLLLLLILFIVKIVQMIGAFRGSGGESWFSSEEESEPTFEEEPTIEEEPTFEEEHPEPEEAEGAPGTEDGPLDWDNPGTIQVEVQNENGDPVQGAEVVIQPANVERNFFGGRKSGSEARTGRTNEEGLFPPEPMQIGSGRVLVSVNKPGFFSRKKFFTGKEGEDYISEKTWVVNPDDHTHVPLVLARSEEGEETGVIKGRVIDASQYKESVAIKDQAEKIVREERYGKIGVEGAKVMPVDFDNNPIYDSVMTGKDGSFTIEVPLKRKFNVYAKKGEKDGWHIAGTSTNDLLLTPNQKSREDIVIPIKEESPVQEPDEESRTPEKREKEEPKEKEGREEVTRRSKEAKGYKVEPKVVPNNEPAQTINKKERLAPVGRKPGKESMIKEGSSATNIELSFRFQGLKENNQPVRSTPLLFFWDLNEERDATNEFIEDPNEVIANIGGTDIKYRQTSKNKTIPSKDNGEKGGGQKIVPRYNIQSDIRPDKYRLYCVMLQPTNPNNNQYLKPIASHKVPKELVNLLRSAERGDNKAKKILNKFVYDFDYIDIVYKYGQGKDKPTMEDTQESINYFFQDEYPEDKDWRFNPNESLGWKSSEYEKRLNLIVKNMATAYNGVGAQVKAEERRNLEKAYQFMKNYQKWQEYSKEGNQEKKKEIEEKILQQADKDSMTEITGKYLNKWVKYFAKKLKRRFKEKQSYNE